jgi:hypothetical protein
MSIPWGIPTLSFTCSLLPRDGIRDCIYHPELPRLVPACHIYPLSLLLVWYDLGLVSWEVLSTVHHWIWDARIVLFVDETAYQGYLTSFLDEVNVYSGLYSVPYILVS